MFAPLKPSRQPLATGPREPEFVPDEPKQLRRSLHVRFFRAGAPKLAVPGVACSLQVDQRRTTLSASSDAEGLVHFELPGRGEAFLDTPFEDTRVLTVGQGASRTVEIAVPFALILRGTVVAPDRTRVEGATIYQAFVGERSCAVEVGRSGADGSFVAEPVFPEGFLFARASEFAESVAVRIQAELVTSEVLLMLEPAAEYLGRVVGPDGRPVVGASVWIGSRLDRWSTGNDGRPQGFFPPARRCMTDADGRFHEPHGPSHAREPLTVVADGFASKELDNVEPGMDVTVELEGEHVVSGWVHGPDGQALDGAYVDWGTPASFAGRSATCDAEGRFVLDGLPRLEVLSIRVGAPGFRSKDLEVPAEAAELDVTLHSN
jgi:hypothetical protein